MEAINREVWASGRVQRIFSHRRGWTDPGESLVMERIADAARGRSILDIGVGGGRTIAYLRSLSEDYVAIDYLDELVHLTRSRFPEARVELGDARELSQFADASIDVAVFSFNGIDGLAPEDRPRVFGAVARVLRPGGLFAYSTHNLEHRHAGRPPWHPARIDRDSARGIARSLLLLPRSALRYKRLGHRTVRGEGWATLVDPAYDFSVVWHYVTLEQAIRELQSSGLTADIEAYTTAGARVDPGDDTTESPWLHFIARSPAT
jgi:SAM-dependent methyltransferase